MLKRTLENWHVNSNVISKAVAADKQPTSKRSFETNHFFSWETIYSSDSNIFENWSLRMNYMLAVIRSRQIKLILNIPHNQQSF